MRRLIIAFTVLIVLTGCSSWGDYEFQSDKFKFTVRFPDNWEVWDRSDDSQDLLVAALADKPEAKIVVTAIKSAPDLSPNEIYPTFEGGGNDAGVRKGFGVDGKGTISANNGEGRFIKVHWSGDKFNMRGFRALFIGNRFQLSINAEMKEDDYNLHEQDFLKMVRMLNL
jgi:hypothetical protein